MLAVMLRRIAQVAEPDHRVDHLPVAVLDLPVEDAPAGVAAEVGLEQAHRDPPLRVDLEEPPSAGMISWTLPRNAAVKPPRVNEVIEMTLICPSEKRNGIAT